MTRWFGHDRQIAELIAAPDAGRMHHGWILAGPKGVGKAGIGLDFAKRLLVSGADRDVPRDQLAPDEEGAIAKLVGAGAHPDFMRLERLEKDDKRSEGSGTLARNITVDQVRSLARLLNNAPSLGTRRVILIDSADDLETGAANALLKNLEEPPSGAVFLLIAHAPGRLLPTIRSRCRMMRFHPLDEPAMSAALAAILPDRSEDERRKLARMAEGSPGQALEIQSLDLPALEEALTKIASGSRSADGERARLVQSLSPVSARARLDAFVTLVPRFIADRTRGKDAHSLAIGIEAYDEARRISAGAITPLQLEPGALVHRLCEVVSQLR